MLLSDRSLSPSASEHWRRRAYDVLTSADVASKRVGPRPPAEWAAVLRQLEELSRAPTPAPEWWTPGTAFFGSIETRADPTGYHWDGMTRLKRRDHPLFFFQFTLAGWGEYQSYGQAPNPVPPGNAFLAIVPSEHRYYLPRESPGWTFGWLGIYHPYLLERVSRQVAETGPLVETPPDGTLTASALRLVRGAIKKDFHDKYEVELALFEFVLAYERSLHEARDRSGERRKLLDGVRALVTGNLPKALTVDDFAADHCMTRSHFSHYFRERTGMTPARFALEVRVHQAARMLIETRAPLKQIAAACGFSDANHFCKVFRRFQHLSPTSFRNAVR